MEGAFAPRQKSFEDYLHDVAGESHELDDEEEEEMQRLNVERSASEDNKSATPLTLQRKPRGSSLSGMVSPQLTEARSFVNGLLSPFSPLLELPEERQECLEFVSLQPCRKVSVVVRVLPCNEDVQRCLFPHVNSSNPVIHMRQSPHDMVVVKPSAFGKVIPSSVTMETARLVAQVARISSEDWARLYEFHHVMWPTQDDGQSVQEQFSTMDSLSRAVVQDALGERQSSLLISLGQAPTCVGDTFDQQNCQLSKIIAHCRRLMEPKSVATISIVELKEGKNSFRDLLNRRNKQVAIRHVDMQGAVLEGLSQIPIDEIHNHWPTTQTSTIVATISVWDNAVSHQMSRGPDSQITCVELAISLDSNAKAQNKNCTVSLGSALRQLLRHSSESTDPVIAFRESTITEVLQRSLESSKIVLLASVSQLSHDYETTLSTLNFLRSLIVKQGKTASSPFTKHPLENSTETEDTATMTDMLQEYVTDETILQQITADPRQRLAKIMKPSPSKQHSVDIETVPSIEDDYNPIDYMRDLDSEEPSWHSPVSREQAKQSTIPSRKDGKRDLPIASLPTNQDDWSMEEPIEHPVAYPSFSESSKEETERQLSQPVTPQAEEPSFDLYGGEGAVNDHSAGGISHREDDYPRDAHELYSNERVDGPYAYPDSEHSSPRDNLYDDEQKYEEMFGSSGDLRNEGRLSIQLLDDSSHESDGVLSLVQHEYGQEEDGTDVSHEIVFEIENDGEYDNDSLSHMYEQSQMWQESQHYEDGHDDSQVLDRSVDESLISRESRSTGPFAERKITSEHSNMYDHSSLHDSRQDSPSRQRSAFEAVQSVGNAQSSLQGSERPSRTNVFNGRYHATNSNGGKIHLLEGTVEQIQNMQNALWKSSEESLARLTAALSTQSGEMKLLEEERDSLAKMVSALKAEIQRVSVDHDARLHRYEEEVQVLEAKHQAALHDKRELQKTLDIATSVGDDANGRVEQLERELQHTNQQLVSSEKAYRSVLSSRDELQNEARALKLETGTLGREKEMVDRNCTMLEQSLSDIEKENMKLVKVVTSKSFEVRELSKQLKQRATDQEDLEEKFRRLEDDRRQESLELEKLRFSLKSLESSLEDAEKEKNSVEESRQQDKRRVEQMEADLAQKNLLYEELLTQERSLKALNRDLEQKVVLADDEARAQESVLGRWKERCQSLEDKINQSCADRAFWEEQAKQLNRTVEELEEERRLVSQEKRMMELKIQQLEQALNTGDELARVDIDRLRDKYLQSERERHELETQLTRSKTEYYDEDQKRTRELVDFQRRVDELEQECRLTRGREAEMVSAKDNIILSLQAEVATCSADLERSNKRCADLELNVQEAEQRILVMTDKIERYRNELIKSREEADAAFEKRSAQTALDVRRLTERMFELEQELTRVVQEREKLLKRSKEEDSTIRLLSVELQDTRDELAVRQTDVHRLQKDLTERKSENERHEEQLAALRGSMETFRATAQAQFGALTEENQDIARNLDALRGDKENLHALLHKAEAERDACFACLMEGREKLSQVIKRGKAGDFLEGSYGAGVLTAYPSLSTNIRRGGSSDLYLTANSIDQLLVLRAEEIAGCLALSARETIRGTNDENSSLRFRLNSVEGDKRAAVAALKIRIRDIEEDLGGGLTVDHR